MTLHVAWSSPQERRLITDEALGLLERHGMRFGQGDALRALAASGATVDWQQGVARIPTALVEEAVARCPHEFVLGGARPEDDCAIGEGPPRFLNSGGPTVILDHRSGERRSATVQDLREATAVLDATPAAGIIWPLVCPTDCSEERSTLIGLATQLAHTHKHVQHDVDDRGQVAAIVRMAEATGGDVRSRPRVSVVCCTASPLQVHPELLDASTDLAAAGIPVVVMSLPIAGATAPITIAGSVTVGVAEVLGTITAIQVRAPGAKLFFSLAPALLDMRQTTFVFGAVETYLQTALGVEIGHDLGLPCVAPGPSTDAKHPGAQAAFEKALKSLVVTSTGADLMTGLGMLESANLPSLPQIVIDDEVTQMILRLWDGMEITPQTVMAADIERLGFTGAFLKEKETRRRLRAGEQILPLIADRSSYDHWQAAGRDELAVACGRVEEILAEANERGPLLTESQLRELDECVNEGSPTGAR